MRALGWIALLLISALPRAAVGEELAAGYIESYFAAYPSRATAAGRTDLDHRLEDFPADKQRAWIACNREFRARVRDRLAAAGDEDERLDLVLLERQIGLELERWERLRLPERDPLFWSSLAAEATVFLLVRADRPAAERLAAAAERAASLPRLARQAEETLAGADPSAVAPQLAERAAAQLRALATYYREGFASTAVGETAALRHRLATAGEAASRALGELADFCAALAGRAGGSPRLGESYAELFALYTGLAETPAEVAYRVERELVAARSEAAVYGRAVWPELMGELAPPADDRLLLDRLFRRLEEDRADTVEAFVADYRQLLEASLRFVREQRVATVPESLPIWIGTSPDYLAGQGVGGVYPPGPFAADSPTLLFLPTPSSGATAAEKQALFAAFNHPFNVMIVPHELVPGHTLQLVAAARHRRPVRALFPDDVAVEGWGTFSERLMLDLGWGDSAARLAHWKKRLENIARTVVDIRFHTAAASEQEILRFVREEALQDDGLAGNLYRRVLAGSPQLTTYHLGYRQVSELYEAVRRARGDSFVVQRFTDEMMALGPVPVAEARRKLLALP